MEYCNANLYSNTPVLQNSILFSPVYHVNPVKFLIPLILDIIGHYLNFMQTTRIPYLSVQNICHF